MQLELKQAVKDFRRKWKWAGVAAIMGMLAAAAMIMAGSIWPETEKIAQMLEQKRRLTAEVSALQGAA